MGCRPDWYSLIHASRYLGIPADRLLEMPPIWLTWASIAESTEAEVEYEIFMSHRPRD